MKNRGKDIKEKRGTGRAFLETRLGAALRSEDADAYIPLDSFHASFPVYDSIRKRSRSLCYDPARPNKTRSFPLEPIPPPFDVFDLHSTR